MMKKLVLFGLVVACFALPSVVSGGSDPADVSITATVDSFAEWADASPSIGADDWSAHITAVNQAQTRLTAAETYYKEGMVNETIQNLAGFSAKEQQAIEILKNSGVAVSAVDTP